MNGIIWQLDPQLIYAVCGAYLVAMFGALVVGCLYSKEGI